MENFIFSADLVKRLEHCFFCDPIQVIIFIISSSTSYHFLLGVNMFLTRAFRSPINTVSYTLLGEGLHLSEHRYHHASQYNLNTNISIKEFRLHTFSRQKPFINIENTMFQWRNYTGGSRQRYDWKVRIFT